MKYDLMGSCDIYFIFPKLVKTHVLLIKWTWSSLIIEKGVVCFLVRLCWQNITGFQIGEMIFIDLFATKCIKMDQTNTALINDIVLLFDSPMIVMCEYYACVNAITSKHYVWRKPQTKKLFRNLIATVAQGSLFSFEYDDTEITNNKMINFKR